MSSKDDQIAFLAKLAAARPGLWANIRAKKKRGESAAKPGDEDYPDSKNWSKVTAISEKKAQCWEGYERVPGTKALTPGSCRPAGKKKKEEAEKQSGAAWQTAEGKNPEGGLNDKGRASLKAQGHDIKRPQPEGGARKDSFCARMGGMKAKLTSSETANDPDSRINKALRKWKCGSDAFEQIDSLAKQAVASLTPTQAASASIGSSILNGAQPAMAGHMQTVAKTYDASTPKQMSFNGKPAGQPFYRGDLQQQPGPTNTVGNINANTGAFNRYQGASGHTAQSTSVGRFGTYAPKPIG